MSMIKMQGKDNLYKCVSTYKLYSSPWYDLFTGNARLLFTNSGGVL